MKKILYLTSFLAPLFLGLSAQVPSKYICTDQFGYLPDARKIAVIRDPQVGYDAEESFTPGSSYSLVNAYTGEKVYSSSPVQWNSGNTDASSGDKAWQFDFSSVTTNGRYFVLDSVNGVQSYEFEISPNVYNDVLAQAVRSFFYQRAGFEKLPEYAGVGWSDGASHIGPLQDKNCRLFSDKNNSDTERDLSGGWYDAGDYNKYTNWTASYVIEMMKAYIEKPFAWGDNYNIPESGNSIPDLLDEAQWGMDWLLRMQKPDGGVLSIVSLSHASPPSSAKGQSVYGPASTSASLNTSAAFAIGSKVYRSINMVSYADTLVARAKKAWNWANMNPAVIFNNNSSENASLGVGAGNQETDDYGRLMAKLEAACYLFDATGDTTYRDFFDANYQLTHLLEWNFAYPYETSNQETLLYYTTIEGATSTVVSTIKNVYLSAMLNNTDNFPAFNGRKDPYMGHLDSYTWGSNGVKAGQGSMFYNVISYSLNSAKNADARFAAQGYINYLHGLNPLNLVYLSNMYNYGGDNCVNEFYHSWFENKSAKWDRVGVSTYGPPPGFLTGGPNPGYDWDGCCPGGCGSSANNSICLSETISPPKNQPKQKSYKDFNTSWPLNSWSVTENSCGYQVNYIRLLSKFVTSGLDCNGDLNGSAFLDTCGICSGGNTGRLPETIYCNCSKYFQQRTLDISECRSYTSPSGKYTWITPGTYTDTISSFKGCDSIITINLTFREIDTSVSVSGDTLSSDANEANFRWLDCGNNFLFTGSTEKTFTPLNSGNYALEVTQNGCADTSICYFIEVTGILNRHAGNKIMVYPNPSSGKFKVDISGSHKNVETEIRNSLGKTIRKESFAETNQISFSINEPPGIYFLFIRRNQQDQKVVKFFIH